MLLYLTSFCQWQPCLEGSQLIPQVCFCQLDVVQDRTLLKDLAGCLFHASRPIGHLAFILCRLAITVIPILVVYYLDQMPAFGRMQGGLALRAH